MTWSPNRIVRCNGARPHRKFSTCASVNDSRACMTLCSGLMACRPVSTLGSSVSRSPSRTLLESRVPSFSCLLRCSSTIRSLASRSRAESVFLSAATVHWGCSWSCMRPPVVVCTLIVMRDDASPPSVDIMVAVVLLSKEVLLPATTSSAAASGTCFFGGRACVGRDRRRRCYPRAGIIFYLLRSASAARCCCFIGRVGARDSEPLRALATLAFRKTRRAWSGKRVRRRLNGTTPTQRKRIPGVGRDLQQ